jgi:spermidine synthase
MQIPFWKKWMSYVSPVTLEETGTELNPELCVRLDRGRLQLLSGNAIYSWDDLYRNFTIALGEIALHRRPAEQDVLLLGLGLGSVPYILEKVYFCGFHYLAVEWDEGIAELAQRYTLSRLDSSVEVVIADADLYVDICEDQFDLLIMDIFEDQTTPPHFETEDFLERCAARMRPGALLLYNRLYDRPGDRERTEHFYEQVVKKVFPNSRYVDTDGNWVIIAEK